MTTTELPHRLPTDRYWSPEWAERERRALWPRVWQLACTVDHVPEPGDVYEYRCGDLSVLVVRTGDGRLRAFQNACRHRGSAICEGQAAGLTELRCPYHRWSWTLDGELREVPSRREFGAVRNDDLPLLAVAVDTWGPFVFVNVDAAAEPLADYLEGVPADVEWAGLDRYVCRYGISVPLPCNWKTAIEAFGETYHVQGIHPEMLAMCDDVHSPNALFGKHGRLLQPYGVPSPRLGRDVGPQRVWEGFVEVMGVRVGRDQSVHPGPHPPIPDGETLRDVLDRMVREQLAARGVDAGRFSQEQVLDLFQYNLFPNATVVLLVDLIQVMRARPGATPDECWLDGFFLERVADEGPRGATRVVDVVVPPGEADFGLVLNQDVENLQRVQRGLHQPGLREIVLSAEEIRIVNQHRWLERYVGA
ncbi:MAG: (2Fe-2S)-binding protein [Acidimicrobiia bacterium]|nr:MAG: (2Fe-2S)-binding protein [Acidimicrobiia bacterium]